MQLERMITPPISETHFGSSPIHSKFSLQTIGSRWLRLSPSFLHSNAHSEPQICPAVQDTLIFLFFIDGNPWQRRTIT